MVSVLTYRLIFNKGECYHSLLFVFICSFLQFIINFLTTGIKFILIGCLIATELGAFLEPLNLPTKQFVFLAVNNNQSTNQAGGTHW